MLAAGILLAGALPVNAATQVLDVRVSGSENDAEEGSLGAVLVNGVTLDMGGLFRKIGMRFTNITIPKNAPITRAYIEFTTKGQDSTTTTFKIEGQASDNAGAFTTSSFNVSVRPTYSTEVDWLVNYPWLTENEVHQTADVTAIVQKIVKRDGWASGNAMAFILSNDENIYRKAYTFDSDPNKAPKLHIEYTVNVIEVPVTASTDDVYQLYYSPGSYTVYNSTVFQIAGTTYNYPALRFQNVDIPQGSLINYACIKFTAKEDRAAETGYVRFYGEKRLDPPTFSTSGSYNNVGFPWYRKVYSTIPKTSSTASWSGHPAWTTDQVYTSVDLKNVVQEIVGQAGWDTSSKSMAFHLCPMGGTLTRKAWSFDGDPSKAPVLHIEYGQAEEGGGSGVAVMTLSSSELGRSCFEGSAAENQFLTLMNSGAATLAYTVGLTYGKGSGWLSITPADAAGSLGPGEEQNFTLAFNSTGLTSGIYDAYLRFTDPNAANSPREVKVSLAVMPQGTLHCGDIPLYTQNISSPAVMVLLDLSGSMEWEMDIIPDDYDYGASTTPDISSVVQEIVNRDGWVPGNAIMFILDKVAGTGYRVPRMFDNYSPSAALLHVEYIDGGADKVIETRVKTGTDDAAGISAGFATNWQASANKMSEGGNGRGIAFRFQELSIPKNATITKAYMQYVPYMTHADPITVKVSAHASDNSPTFPSMGGALELTTSYRPRTAAGVNWEIPPWTGVTIETKIGIAKTVISELVKDTGISWGFGSWATDTTAGYSSTNDYTLIHAGCAPHTADHQAKIQAAVAGLTTYSSTPFSPSLIAGRKYFNGERGDLDGLYFQEASCQPKFLIEVTDGIGNVDSTVENVTERTNALADAGISTIGIGFGLSEDETAQLYALAETANTRGKADTSDRIYPMHVEAGGAAQPYITKDKDDLMNAFRTIMNNVKGAVFYGSAPAATTSTDLGDTVLVASFNAANWTGNVEAIKKDANGMWSATLWKASEQMPATRSVWTADVANNVSAYTSATLTGDNYLCKPLGDIINSTPVVVGTPPFFYSFDNYAGFKRSLSITSPRPKTIYVGANDGMLHAFSLADGAEKWAFLPYSMQAKVNLAASGATYDPCSTGYCHQSLLDGNPLVADVYANFGGGSKKWRTLLVIGQRGGGTAYTALDVTSGQSPDPGNTDPARVLWELTDPDLGETWADAAIERVAYPGGGAGARAWGAFMTSGYNINDNLQVNQKAFLFGVEADTGTGLWSNGIVPIKKIGLTSEAGSLNYINNVGPNFVNGEVVRGATSGAYGTIVSVSDAGTTGTVYLTNVQGAFQHGEQLLGSLGNQAVVSGTLAASTAAQANNALNSPVTGNFTVGDYTEDCIYTGDLYGTLFRVDNIGKGQTPSVSRLFQFNPYPSNPNDHPIRGKASVAYNTTGSGLWVYYGTGRYETSGDKVNLSPQYFFGLKDTITPRVTPYSLADLTQVEARFATGTFGASTRTVRTIVGSNPLYNPWAMKLFAGQSGWGGPALIGGSERVFTKPLVVGGIVFFTSFIPDADLCTGSGDTWVFAVDYRTGLPPTKPVFDLNGDGKFTDADKLTDASGNLVVPVGVYVGRGQGSAPVLFKDTLFITTSTPQYQLTGPVGSGNVTGLNALLVNIPQKRIRVESWKQN
jgi:hypothetical protein